MPVIPIIFSGKLNFDDSLTLLPKGDFIDALNVTRDQVGGLRDLSVSNIIGNRIRRTLALPTGTNKVIGGKADQLRGRVYYFIWNSNSEHRLEYYDFITDSTVLLLSENLSDPVLLFDENDKIMDIDIIHNNEDGDLLYWNQRTLMPRKINVARALTGYYSPLLEEYIEAAKRPPLLPPTAIYQTDPNIKVNNLKGKLFEFAYRFIYDDFEKSTFSPLSASPLPTLDYLASLNPISNNALQLTVGTGGKTVSKIEVAFRYSIGNSYSDYSSITVLNKEDLGISDNSTYQFIFANDGAYAPIDVIAVAEIQNYFPRRANAQVLVNGNYLVFGGILEGYNGLGKSDLTVTAQVTYEEEEIPEGVIVIGNPSMTINQTDFSPPTLEWDFTIGENVTPGDQYLVICDFFNGTEYFNFQYTALLGDDRDTVANYFVTQINAIPGPVPDPDATFTGSGGFHVSIAGGAGPHFSRSGTIAATSPAGGGAFFDRIYKAGGKYRFGMIYWDEQGRVIGNPVNTYITTPGNINDFEVEIDEFYATADDYIRPVVNLTVQHLPPAEAKSFSFLRTNNLLVQSFFNFKTDDFEEDAGFWYISQQDVLDFVAANPNFSSKWTFQEGDRLKFMYQYNGANASGWGATYGPVLDFPIIGVVTEDFGGGDKSYIKVQAYPGTVTPAPDDNIVFEVYRPSVKTSESQQQYFEFGETYECVVIDGINYHEGQTAITNPTFEFRDGDVYIRIRSGAGDDYLILDPNFSDYYASAINSNGRAFVENENASETYNPVLVRFSQAYQFGTNINGLNTFYEGNFDEYNRSFGDIKKLDQVDSYMKVGQKFKIGNVPVLLQMVRDFNAENILATSDTLLNKINYYDGDYGVGDAPEAWAGAGFVRYFCDTNRGVVCRLSMDGITVISIIYKIDSWATRELPLRTGNSKIYGVYNSKTNKYEFSLESAVPNNSLEIGVQRIVNYDGQFLVSVDEEDACTGTLLTLYSGEPFAVGTVMFLDMELTTVLTGYNYIVNDNTIYNLDTVTGVVGSETGFTCGVGIFGNYTLDNVLEDICDNLPQGLYTDIAFGTGAFVFYDSTLSTPVTGFDFIGSEGVIYNIDSLTGEVGVTTGITCGSGVAGTYIFGNDSGTICGDAPLVYYTNGPFAIGSIMYLDENLTTPVTGFDFMVNVSDDTIYNIDSTTGEVLSTTGLTCGGGGDNFLVFNSSGAGIIDSVFPVVYTITTGSFPINSGQNVQGVHLGFSSALSVSLSGSITGSLVLSKNSIPQQTLPVSGEGVYNFSAVTFTISDICEITLSNA